MNNTNVKKLLLITTIAIMFFVTIFHTATPSSEPIVLAQELENFDELSFYQIGRLSLNSFS